MIKVVPHLDAKIYHITHIRNLPGILKAGGLWSDAKCDELSVGEKNIGILRIKERRRNRRDPKMVGSLGEYVPFNFCNRSVMLLKVKSGHENYVDGDADVLHLVSSVRIATRLGKPWAFTDRHAVLNHALYFDRVPDLGEVPWKVMPLTYWQDVREEREAEFLVHEFFPWTAISEVAAKNEATAERARKLIRPALHRPDVTERPAWYY